MQAAERYAEALTIDEYLSRMRQNRERFLENIERTAITPEEKAFFSDHPLRVLVITEDWCADSVQLVPALVKLSREVPDLGIRVLQRDQHSEFAARYPRKDGYNAIPIFILFDEEMRELGALIERPARVTQEIAAETRRFQKAHPDLPGINRNVDRMPDETRAAVKANTAAWRVSFQNAWARYLLEDFAQIIKTAEKAREQAA